VQKNCRVWFRGTVIRRHVILRMCSELYSPHHQLMLFSIFDIG